jgi:hypothetical protein
MQPVQEVLCFIYMHKLAFKNVLHTPWAYVFVIPERHSSIVLIVFIKTCGRYYGMCLLQNTAVVGGCAVQRDMDKKQCCTKWHIQ